MKLRAMVEVEVELTEDEWTLIRANYVMNWSDEILAGDVPTMPSAADAWQGMLQLGEPDDFEVSWDLCTDENFVEESG